MTPLATLVSGEPAWISVEGASMLPLLRSGDRVRVDPTLSPRVGDIVLALVEERFIVHRVTRLAPHHVETHGDNREGPDPETSTRRLLGVITHSARGGVRLPLRWSPRLVRLYLHLHPKLIAGYAHLSRWRHRR